MRITPASICIALLSAWMGSPACAGSVFGTVADGTGPLKQRSIEIRCPQRSISTKTDDAGAYRAVVVNFAGRCELVLDPPQGPTASVVLHPDAARFDFVLDGGQLRRR